MELWEGIKNAIDFVEVLKYSMLIGFFFLALFGFLKFFLRKELRLYKNLQRTIFFIAPSDGSGVIRGKEMDLERERLKESKFFNVSSRVSDYQNFNPQDRYGLVVLGYDKNMVGLDDILTKIKNLQIPLIIYTYGENVLALNPADKEKFDSYPWALFANFKLTLMNSIFTTLATYSYGKREGK